MKKIDIIKSSREYTEIINNGQNKKIKNFIIYYRKNNEKNRFGISVPKKIGSAVLRNRIKRQVRSAIGQSTKFENSLDIVLIVRKNYQPDSFDQVISEIQEILKSRKNSWKKEIN